jgi:glycosyltransferase involved in cell wall biosynthesis
MDSEKKHPSPASKFHILTDHGDPQYFVPYRIRISLKSRFFHSRLFRRKVLRWIPALAMGCKCWWVGLRHRGPAPFVTCGAGYSFVLAFLQYLAHPFIRPRTHVMFDLLLEKKRSGLMGMFDTFKMHIFRKAVDRAIVWGPPDIDNFSREYGLPREKFVFLPYSTTIGDYPLDIQDRSYIFAGGNSQRDYKTLIDAVKDIAYPVFIATTLPHVAEMAAPYPHITVRGVTEKEFREKLAGCTIFVQCHKAGELRTVGHQTFLNAMWMGKPVVLADRMSAVGYIEDGKDGLVADAGDAAGLADKIKLLLEDTQLAQRLALAAQKKAQSPRFRPLNHIQAIYNVALKIELSKYGADFTDEPLQLY